MAATLTISISFILRNGANSMMQKAMTIAAKQIDAGGPLGHAYIL